jgi:Holliday junction DNA helicase RuvA
MIGKLNGIVENIFDDHLLIDVNGVCYIVFCTAKLLQNLSLAEKISIFIHTMQKDEMPTLYGFREYQEKELFLLLTSVQGVGGRMGIALIGEIDPLMLISAIQQENPKILQQVSGIGAKIAVRIINELKSNKRFFTTGYAYLSDSNYHLKQDAISALVNLGFKKSDVIAAVEYYIKYNTALDLELIIRNSIAQLNKV